jgi:hypothetical protein
MPVRRFVRSTGISVGMNLPAHPSREQETRDQPQPEAAYVRGTRGRMADALKEAHRS